MGIRFTGGQVRYFRRLRAASALATVRRKARRAEEHPRPLPKRIKHLEDVLFENGLRFVRPGQPERILGGSIEGLAVSKQ